MGRINPISQPVKDVCLFKMPKPFSEWGFRVVLPADYSEGTTATKRIGTQLWHAKQERNTKRRGNTVAETGKSSHTGWCKSRFILVSVQNTEFLLVLLLFINYCIIFHMNNYKPTFVPPCI